MRGKKDIMPDFCSRRFPFHYTTALNILMKMGIDISNINILSVGEYENYKGEVREQKPRPGTTIDSDTKIVLKVGSPSAVDYMPYQFFYGLRGIRDSGREWDERARCLMAPFESSIIRRNSIARFLSLKYDIGIIDQDYLVRILKLYGFDFSGLDTDTAEMLFWFSAFSSFHFWAGNPEAVEKVLTSLFGYDFKIIENVKAEYEIPPPIQYRLGAKSGRLGKETVIGRSFVEYDSGYTVVIMGVEPEDVEKLLPGRSLREKLEWVLSICMPSNLDYHPKIKVDVARTKVGRERRESYLGYSTFI
jgi:hypothetical protein